MSLKEREQLPYSLIATEKKYIYIFIYYINIYALLIYMYMKSLEDVKTQLSYEEQRSSSSLQKLSITSQKASMSKESYPFFF